MKKNILLILITLFATMCNAQNKFDLQKLTFKEDPKELLKDRKKHADPAEGMTTLPAYLTDEVNGFSYGSASFTAGGENGPTDMDKSNISFVLNSVAEKKIVGLIIRIEKTIEAKKLDDYISHSFTKPSVLSNVPKPNRDGEKLGQAAYLYRNIQPGVSMIKSVEYSLKDKKPATALIVYIIKNDAVPSPNVTGFKTVLDRMIKSFAN